MTCSFGFYGKIPARGDFVRAGLPRGFIDPWDAWLQRLMAESRERLADAWLPAWLEAPIWRFRLQAGICGDAPAIGLFMPSVDRAGRHFPLTLACVDPALSWPALSLSDATQGQLDQAEATGFAALEDDIDPDQIIARLQAPSVPRAAGPIPQGRTAWWTDGSPRVPPTAFASDGMPDGARLAAMLDADFSAAAT